MTSYLLFIPPDTKNKQALFWLFRTALLALNIKKVKVDDQEIHGCETTHTHSFNTVLTDPCFNFIDIHQKTYSFNNEGVILNEKGEDELFTAFYLINSIQEYSTSAYDSIGRFEYKNSFQEKFGKTEINFVTALFEKYFVKNLPHLLENRQNEKSVFFISHDIDSLYGAFFQDGLSALKAGRFDVIARLIANAIILKPDWFNIDKILKIESEYDLRSTFFWIVNKGKVSEKLTNADYSIHSKRIRNTLQMITERGGQNGLHKSLSDQTFDEEIVKLSQNVIANRNHYLKFQLPEHYDQLESSQIKIDCSLGFAEHYGFRNSLAIPFVPFNIKKIEPYHFLEVPLNIMDGTFQKYMQVSPKETTPRMLELIEKNKYNSVISVLWHNHFFNTYRFKGYFEPYIELLTYLKEQDFKFVNTEQLYDKYYLSSLL